MAWTTPRTWTTGEIVTAAYMNTHIRDNLLETAPAKVTTTGDLIVGNGSNALKRLGIGSAYSVLSVNAGGTDAAWSNPHLNDYSNHSPYATTGGTSTAYTVTLSPSPSSLTEGFGITIKVHTTNTTAATLNVNSLGAKILKNHFGTSYVAGELVAGRIYNFRYNGTDFLAVSAAGMDLYFGSGSDGALNTTGNVTFTTGGYTGWVYKEYSSITINAGHTVTADQGCRGMVLYCTGNVSISGTLSMNQKGTYVPGYGGIVPLPVLGKTSGWTYISKFGELLGDNITPYGGSGGSGGYGGGYSGSYRASAGDLNDTGRLGYGGHGTGGGGGCAGYNSTGGGGTPGASGGHTYVNHYAWPTDYEGNEFVTTNGNVKPIAGFGCGGQGHLESGSVSYPPGGISIAMTDTGYGNGGGGGGNGGVGYMNNSDLSAPNGGLDGAITGGLIVIIAKGNVTINNGGLITANGGNGGTGGAGKNYAGGGGGGGGSGGGCVVICHLGTYTNNGSITVNGGSGGAGGAKGYTTYENGQSGTAGSAGTILTCQLIY